MGVDDIITIVVSVVLTPTLTFLITELITWIKSKKTNAKLDRFLDLAEKSVIKAVKAVMQTYVDSLKKGGAFNEEEQRIAFLKARNKAIELMGAAAFEAIGTVYGDNNAWLESTIEATIQDIKKCAEKAAELPPAA